MPLFDSPIAPLSLVKKTHTFPFIFFFVCAERGASTSARGRHSVFCAKDMKDFVEALPLELQCMVLDRVERIIWRVLYHVSVAWRNLVLSEYTRRRGSCNWPIAYDFEPTAQDRRDTFMLALVKRYPRSSLPLWAHEQLGLALPERAASAAVRTGHIPLLAWILERVPSAGTGDKLFKAASKMGDIGLVKWLQSHTVPVQDGKVIIWCAARYGHLDLIRWLADEEQGFKPDSVAYVKAAQGGHIHVLEWLHARGIQSDMAWRHAAWHGRVNVTKWLYGQNLQKGPDADSHYPRSAVAGGSLELVEDYYSKYPHTFRDDLCVLAAIHGHLDILKWLCRKLACRWDAEAVREAMRKGHIDIARWAVEHGCPSYSGLADDAARWGNLEMLQWTYDWGHRCTPSGYAMAAKYGHTSVVKWLHARGCSGDQAALTFAAASGHLNIVSWLCDRGCSHERRVGVLVARRGHLAVLECLYRHGFCVASSEMIGAAIPGGHLDIVEWAIAHGAPPGDYHFLAAARMGHARVLACLVQSGYPWNRYDCLKCAHSMGHATVVRWIVRHVACVECAPFVTTLGLLWGGWALRRWIAR